MFSETNTDEEPTLDNLQHKDPEKDYYFSKRYLLSSETNSNEIWVYRVRRRADNKIVVIKLVTFNTNPGHRLYREEESWLNEPKILAKLNNYDETLTLFDVFQDDGFLFIVTEFCEFGDLEQWIK